MEESHNGGGGNYMSLFWGTGKEKVHIEEQKSGILG